MTLQVVHGFPPVYTEIVRKIGRPPATALFTYGDRVFVPSGQTPGPIVLSHEEVHSRQQRDAGGPVGWWQRYLDDRAFRLDQELEAYRIEYRYACTLIPNRGRQRRILAILAKHLSSPMYGRLYSAQQALDAIA